MGFLPPRMPSDDPKWIAQNEMRLRVRLIRRLIGPLDKLLDDAYGSGWKTPPTEEIESRFEVRTRIRREIADSRFYAGRDD